MERVKTACIAAGILILASMADANSCTGESLAEQEASRRVEITVLASGKPLWQAKVELFEYKMVTANRWFLTEERTLRTALFADARGEVRSPKLPPGHYHVVASRGKNHSSDPYVSGNDLVADLYLVVSPHSTTKKSTFSMQLIPRCTMPPPAPPQWSQVVEQMRVKDRVLAFSGTVYDQSGAPRFRECRLG